MTTTRRIPTQDLFTATALLRSADEYDADEYDEISDDEITTLRSFRVTPPRTARRSARQYR